MPLRDYKCRKCGNVSEHIVKHDESNAPTTCDQVKIENMPAPDVGAGVVIPRLDGMCGGELERVQEIGRTGFELRGSGWAADSYR